VKTVDVLPNQNELPGVLTSKGTQVEISGEESETSKASYGFPLTKHVPPQHLNIEIVPIVVEE
jgi:hypothetical protein